MNAKLLKIFNDLGWIHEEEGKVTVWEQPEFDPTELSKNIRNFKNICLEEFEDCNIETEDIKWDNETQTYTMDYRIVSDRIYELRKILEELRHHYNQNNLVNECENRVSKGFTLEINIFREIHLTFIEMIITLTEENILMEGFVEAVLNEDNHTVEQIFEEAYQRLK
nr:MAG TPA: hypothetical protein [Bacteriophage sp.]